MAQSRRHLQTHTCFGLSEPSSQNQHGRYCNRAVSLSGSEFGRSICIRLEEFMRATVAMRWLSRRGLWITFLTVALVTILFVVFLPRVARVDGTSNRASMSQLRIEDNIHPD